MSLEFWQGCQNYVPENVRFEKLIVTQAGSGRGRGKEKRGGVDSA